MKVDNFNVFNWLCLFNTNFLWFLQNASWNWLEKQTLDTEIELRPGGGLYLLSMAILSYWPGHHLLNLLLPFYVCFGLLWCPAGDIERVSSETLVLHNTQYKFTPGPCNAYGFSLFKNALLDVSRWLELPCRVLPSAQIRDFWASSCAACSSKKVTSWATFENSGNSATFAIYCECKLDHIGSGSPVC